MLPFLARHAVLKTRVSAVAYSSALRRCIPRSFPQLRDRSLARMVHTVDNNIVDPSMLIEEELVRGYREKDYYPVKIGDLFQDRYKVIGKLGYGSASTVWLCRDGHREKDYVALKVYINSSKVHRELPIYAHINSLNSKHDGCIRVRRMLDSFELSGPDGKHTCLVHEALGMNLEEFLELLPGEVCDPDLLRQILRNILRAMDFLRGEARVIHTDIQPRNILLGVLDNSAFVKFEEYEDTHPVPRKELPSRIIYASRPMLLTTGTPSLCDLSEARFDGPQNTDLIMPDVYRAPEVVLGMPWSYPVDLWALAMTLWDLFEPERLFSAHGEEVRYSEHHHLAQMVSIMGPPPLDFLQRSEKCRLFWDAEGNWKGEVPIPENDVETAEQRLQGDEKKLFLAFLRKILQWRPEDRSDIHNVFMDEWLLADLIRSGQVEVE